LRIGKAITDAIKRERLVAGDPLPSMRALAKCWVLAV
jgi:DNA-binding transcriptional regulator YhcF (GntR family)